MIIIFEHCLQTKMVLLYTWRGERKKGFWQSVPKSVNFFLGWCINSAYSLPSSILWSCSTRGRRVTIPGCKIHGSLQGDEEDGRLHVIFGIFIFVKMNIVNRRTYLLHEVKSPSQQHSQAQKTSQNSKINDKNRWLMITLPPKNFAKRICLSYCKLVFLFYAEKK